MQRPADRLARRRRLLLLAGLTLATTAGALVWSGNATASPTVNAGPDVVVLTLSVSNSSGAGNYGSSGGYHGYSVGTTSCGAGTTPVTWCNGGESWGCASNEHPVIGQNLYRLKNGHFEQIGMSWLKHGFISTNSPSSACATIAGVGSCIGPPHGGEQLGIGCQDTYGPSLNGSRPLGMRYDVNPTTGFYPTNYSTGDPPPGSDPTNQRLKVLEADIDPASNAGARYWVEGQYVTADDAMAGNGLNNASYQEVTFGAATTYNIALTGTITRMKPAINAWKDVDPLVDIFAIDLPASSPLQRYDIGRRVTETVPGTTWHYEYAVHNMNANDVARGFEVRFPAATTFSNVGIHEIKHHSSEPYTNEDWASSSCRRSIRWGGLPAATAPDGNAIRWGTTFSFWFDADQPPTGLVERIDLLTGDVIYSDDLETGTDDGWCQAVQ